MRVMAIRGALAAAVMVPLVCVTFLNWIGRLDARTIPASMRWTLGGMILLWPGVWLMSWWTTRRSLLRIKRGDVAQLGSSYRMTHRGIMRGEHSLAGWKDVVAYRLMEPDDEGVRSILLVRRDGFHKRVVLPADRTQADVILAAIAGRVPIYDASWHGQIDETADVPRWVSLSLVAWVMVIAVCCWFASPAIMAFVSKFDRDWRRLLILLSIAVAAILCGGWEMMVRREFNPIQRARIRGLTFGGIMSLLMIMLGAAAYASERESFQTLNTISEEARIRMTHTVMPHDRHH